MKSKFYIIVTLFMLMENSFSNPINTKAAVATEFIILHNNDMHARFEQTSKDSSKCQPKDAESGKCYGGFARVAHEVRKFRQEAQNGGTPVLYLNAGDTYTGTPWFTIFKDNITAAFLNILKPDAISLGNHEFDENVEGLVPFLNEVDFPVLACNLDLTKVPEISSSKKFALSTVLNVNGAKVGIVGYLTPDTKFLVPQNSVEYKPEIKSINEETARMKADGVEIIIALGHSGYQMDKDIARQCLDVDIVIGGHTNTFLYSGMQPDSERIDGPYPTLIKQTSGKEVPVVQAYAYTKYLGKIHIQSTILVEEELLTEESCSLNYDEIIENESQRCEFTPSSSKKRRNDNTTPPSTFDAALNAIVSMTKPSREKDIFDNFGESMASQLRSMPEEAGCRTMVEIQALIYERKFGNATNSDLVSQALSDAGIIIESGILETP